MDLASIVQDTEWTRFRPQTEGQTDKVKPVYSLSTLLNQGYNAGLVEYWYIYVSVAWWLQWDIRHDIFLDTNILIHWHPQLPVWIELKTIQPFKSQTYYLQARNNTW